MLGKLMKYDFRASAKIFFLLHALFLAGCLLGRFFFVNRLDFSGPPDTLIVSVMIALSLLFFLIMVLNFSTWLLITFRFYRSLFSKEGYLNWTLPVSGLQHLWAKIISGYIFMAADTVIVAAGILLLVTGKNVTEAYRVIAPQVTEELGMTLSSFSACMFMLCILSCISSVILTYFCIAAGQLFPSHRVLCAIVVYFITTIVVQILSFVLMLITGYFPGYDYFSATGGSSADYILGILALSIITMFLVTVVAYIITHYIIRKKVNLL